MKTKRGSGGETPLSFNVGAWVIVTIRPLYFQERSLVPTGLEAEWAPEEFWTCLDMSKSFLAWIRTAFLPARSLVSTRPTLTRLYSRRVTQSNISRSRTRALLTHSPKHLLFLDYTRVKILATCCTCVYMNIHFLSR